MSNLYKNFPISPGVYIMKNARGQILYIGKAVNLRRRVQSYFLRPHDSRIQKLVSEIKKVDYKKTDTSLEALILESRLIKKYQPPFNIKDKDDKSFLYVEITKEKFPRVLLERGSKLRFSQSHNGKNIFGPFVSASAIREALKILRRIFPWSLHNLDVGYRIANPRRPCFDYEIGLCPGTCADLISRKDYLKNIRGVKLIFQGKKKKILSDLKKEMELAAKGLKFEKAAKIRRQIFALKHIQDAALASRLDLKDALRGLSSGRRIFRIEGYDISNISGDYAVGSMVVFTNKRTYSAEPAGFRPDKKEYRKFKIKTITKSDDTGMLKEILRRRLRHSINCPTSRIREKKKKKIWKLPRLILVDGGKGQVNAAKSVLSEFGLKIPVIGIAKGPKRKNNIVIGNIPDGVNNNILLRVRDEAHRFAISYHRKFRTMISNLTNGCNKPQ